MSEITPYNEHHLVPSTAELSELFRLSETLCKTNFVPDAFKNKAAETMAAILYGRELGIGPMTSLQQITVIKGKPGASPELMRALVRRAGHSITATEATDTVCVLEGKRSDDRTVERSTFTMDDAKRAGLAGGGAWKTYPKAMLMARATSQLCRSLFADVISGISYTPEELQSIDARPAQSEQVVPALSGDVSVEQAGQDLHTANDAKRILLDRCMGDVDMARSIWERWSVGNHTISVTNDDLQELLADARAIMASKTVVIDAEAVAEDDEATTTEEAF